MLISSSKKLYFGQSSKHSSKFFNIFLMRIQQTFFDSPIGILQINASEDYISAVLFFNTLKSKNKATETPARDAHDHPLLSACIKQLQEYFEGERRVFDLPMSQQGTPFQQQVWSELERIPFGKTISYMELSKRIGNPKAIRAVGTTNGKNSLSILVPCHRVIGSNGELTGYGGDLWRKRWLLDHEAKFSRGVQTLF